MSEPKLASLSEGTIASVMQFPVPWPVASSRCLASFDLLDGAVSIIAEPTGQLCARLSNVDGIACEIRTCVIVPRAFAHTLLMILWNLPSIAVRVNGTLVGSTDPTVSTPVQFHCGVGSFENMDDLSEMNREMVAKRRSKLAGWQPLPRRIQGNSDMMFAALDDELLQLKDLLAWVNQGATHHAPGLASRLRMLVATGKPLPLLQQCAAARDAPLIAFGAPGILQRLPPEIAHFNRIKFDISAQPSGSLRNPVDLDVWLDQLGISIAGEELSHRTLLNQIGSTIGSHFDQDVRASVFVLRSYQTGMAKVPLDGILNYLMSVAAVAVHLAEQLLVDR